METYINILRNIIQNSKMTEDEKQECYMNLDMMYIEVAQLGDSLTRSNKQIKSVSSALVAYETAMEDLLTLQ